MGLVRLRGPLEKMVGGRSEHRIEGGTVIELIQELERVHTALDGWILDERGQIRRHINVFVSGELAAGDTPVGADDPVEVLPAISGG